MAQKSIAAAVKFFAATTLIITDTLAVAGLARGRAIAATYMERYSGERKNSSISSAGMGLAK